MAGCPWQIGLAKHQDRHTPEHLAWLSQENAREQAKSLLKESEPVRSAAARGEVRLMIGMYDMETGQVEFLDLR